MFEHISIPSSFKTSSYLFQYNETLNIPLKGTQPSSYQKGVEDGRKDMEVELLKMGKALYNRAFQNVDLVTKNIIEFSEEKNIEITEIHLNVENWDCARSIIIVKLLDYLDDKIDLLYNEAHRLAEEINDETFHWDYSITYHSESINKEKLISDGFHFSYEHTTRTRQAQ